MHFCKRCQNPYFWETSGIHKHLIIRHLSLAFLIIDTSNFRYEHYHYPADTLERFDCTRLAQIAGVKALYC